MGFCIEHLQRATFAAGSRKGAGATPDPRNGYPTARASFLVAESETYAKRVCFAYYPTGTMHTFNFDGFVARIPEEGKLR